MTFTKKLIATAIAATFVIPSVSFAANIVEVAQSNDVFTSLVEAVVAQDLAGALSDEDAELTVFAPTNDAFANLSPYVARVLEAEPELLTEILLYHVVAGDLRAADVLTQDSLETLQGGSVHVLLKDGNAMINNSVITATDIVADNGVVHVIDEVLLPKKVQLKALIFLIEDLIDAL